MMRHTFSVAVTFGVATRALYYVRLECPACQECPAQFVGATSSFEIRLSKCTRGLSLVGVTFRGSSPLIAPIPRTPCVNAAPAPARCVRRASL